MSTKLSIPPRSIPDEQTISAAAELEVLDKAGNAVKFGEVFRSQKAIVVFIRHFFCGTCQSYVQALASVSEEALVAANARIVVIGCGEAQPIAKYAREPPKNSAKSKSLTMCLGFCSTVPENTGFRVDDIYANPSRSVYYALGMDIGNMLTTPPGVEKRSYVPKSDFMNATTSILKALKQPTNIGKHGDTSQLGGEFILGPGNSCAYASRMEHTADHVEVADLMEAAGVRM